ncbi:hypothetical protein OAA18_00605, partial [bacterium]|nr:hypothetical protein [bacterium]
MADQLFYGSISNTTPQKGPDNSFNRINFNSTAGSATITDVIANGSYAGFDLIFVGMQMTAAGVFTNAIIESFDPVAQTITFDTAALATKTNQSGLGRVSPSKGQYFIASASLYDPQGFQTVRTITGSNDDTYDGSSSIYAIIAPMANTSNTLIQGRFHKYNITDIPYKLGNSEFSFLMQWGEKGEEPSDEQVLTTSNQTIAIVQLSTSESLTSTFSRQVGLMGSTPAGSDQAGYQIELTDFFDDLVISDIYYTGSLVSQNNRNFNFSGSGVEVTLSGSDNDSVLVNIDNRIPVSASDAGVGLATAFNFSGSGVDSVTITDGIAKVYITGGDAGTTGTSGTSGDVGTSGTSGNNGTSGTSGAGTSGTSGEGTSGTSGSGTSGTSGDVPDEPLVPDEPEVPELPSAPLVPDEPDVPD